MNTASKLVIQKNRHAGRFFYLSNNIYIKLRFETRVFVLWITDKTIIIKDYYFTKNERRIWAATKIHYRHLFILVYKKMLVIDS